MGSTIEKQSDQWHYFSFFDQGQNQNARISQKDYAYLFKRDQGEQLENCFDFNKQEQGLFGYRLKKISTNVYKMRPTGTLGKSRVFFYKDKTIDPLANNKKAVEQTDKFSGFTAVLQRKH